MSNNKLSFSTLTNTEEIFKNTIIDFIIIRSLKTHYYNILPYLFKINS